MPTLEQAKASIVAGWLMEHGVRPKRTFASLDPETRLRVVRNYVSLDSRVCGDGFEEDVVPRVLRALDCLERYIAGAE